MPVTSFRVHGVRYQTRDVNRAVEFYTQQLGFALTHLQGTAFASVSSGGTDVFLSGPGSSGARPLPDGQRQEPGGWNRLVLAVSDLSSVVAGMKDRGLQFLSYIVVGPVARAPESLRELSVGDVTTMKVVLAREDDEAMDVLALMREHGIRRIPVVDDDGALVGVVVFDVLVDRLRHEIERTAVDAAESFERHRRLVRVG